jgi:predicted nucleic-acid-binding protein
MPGLDTNVLVRWLVDDDRRQSTLALELFESTRSRGERLFVPSTVALELEWVLRSRYGFDKESILSAFTALLETRELEFQSEQALERALHWFKQGTAEFADCLHAAECTSADYAPMLSFDARAARLPGVRLLAP